MSPLEYSDRTFDRTFDRTSPRTFYRTSRRTLVRPRVVLLPAGASLVLALGACGDREAVHSYTVPKEAAPQAVVPQAPEPRAAAGGPGATAAPAVMQWELPPGWEARENPNSMRFATLSAGAGDARVETAITRLGGAAGGIGANINRWRGQLGLAAQSEEEIMQSAEPVGSGGVWVDLVGPDPHGGEGDGLRMFAAIFPQGEGADTWFLKAVGTSAALEPHRAGFIALCESVGFGGASGSAPAGSPAQPAARPPAAASQPAPRAAARSQGSPGLAWGALPDNWTADATPRSMSVASFSVSDGAQEASVTITPLGGRQDLLANVNRWRRQVGLGPLAALEDEPPAPIEFAGSPGQFVDLAGHDGHTLAVMSERAGTTWFVKMSGPDPLVAGEREGFETFVKSLRLDGGGE